MEAHVIPLIKKEEVIDQQCSTCTYWEFNGDKPHPWGFCKWKPSEYWPWYVQFFSKYTDFNQGNNCKAWRKM